MFNTTEVPEELLRAGIKRVEWGKICEDLNIILHLAIISAVVEHLPDDTIDFFKNEPLENSEVYSSKSLPKIDLINEEDLVEIKKEIISDYLSSLSE